MVAIHVNEALAAKLNALAEAEGFTVEAVLEQLIAQQSEIMSRKAPADRTLAEQQAAMQSLAGLFDEPISDISETTNQSVNAYLLRKHESAD